MLRDVGLATRRRNYGVSFSLRAPMDSVGGVVRQVSLGAIRRRFETALMIAAGYNQGGLLTTSEEAPAAPALVMRARSYSVRDSRKVSSTESVLRSAVNLLW
jgi:hypothetical protein